MNSVGKIALHIKGEKEDFFQDLYGSWERFYTMNLKRPTDEVLMQNNKPEEHLEIETLILDLGNISEENFYNHFASAYKEKLEEALNLHIYNPAVYNVKKTTAHKNFFNLLCHFLLYGNLPWNVESKYKDINLLFMEVALKEGAALKKFLLTYGHYTALQRRLVYQLHDTTLEEGVMLITPGQSSFIISYVSFLKEKYKTIQNPVITPSVYRHVVWEVVYTYLLNNKGSFFNRKTFIKFTINNLAKRHNLTYQHLLRLITAELEKPQSDEIVRLELFAILQQLKNEMPQEIQEGSSVADMARIYKAMAATVGQNRTDWKGSRFILKDLLKSENSCRTFLQHLAEAEIIGLVKVIIPKDHVFVVRYAKALEKQKEKGLLQGKAGGEFRLLKWQIIFPILLENNGGFNRKYFVLRTLKRVAAHYNIELKKIIAFFLIPENRNLLQDTGLVQLLEILQTENQGEPDQKYKPVTITDKLVISAIRNKQVPSVAELLHLKVLLAKTDFREKILDNLRDENEHELFTSILFPVQGHTINAYAKGLELYGRKHMTGNKAGGTFSKIKWKFIHAVLFEPQQAVFNKKYFVERVLTRIAAHYNLKSADLIIIFYKDIIQSGHNFPFELVKVLKELYEEHIHIQRTNTNIPAEEISKISPVQTAKKRLEYYFGKDAGLSFIIDKLAEKHEFIEYIEEVLRVEIQLRRYFTTSLNINVNIKSILKMLLRFSSDSEKLTRTLLLTRILLFYMSITNSKKMIFKVEHKLNELANTNTLVKHMLQYNNYKVLKINKDMLKEKEVSIVEEKINNYVNNAGLVLLHPYLPRLFAMLKLTEEGSFIDEEAQIKAIFLMQYAVFGKTDFAEHEMQLNKLLAGVKADLPIPTYLDITIEEKEIVESLLNAVIQNWSKLGSTSVDGLRGTFLIRDGMLNEHDDFYQLTVEEKAFDILLGSLPWSISTIKYSWMENGINVKWR